MWKGVNRANSLEALLPGGEPKRFAATTREGEHPRMPFPSSYLPLAGRSGVALCDAGVGAIALKRRAVARQTSHPTRRAKKRDPSPSRGGMEQAGALRREPARVMSKSTPLEGEDCGAPIGRVRFCKGSLSAPRIALKQRKR